MTGVLFYAFRAVFFKETIWTEIRGVCRTSLHEVEVSSTEYLTKEGPRFKCYTRDVYAENHAADKGVSTAGAVRVGMLRIILTLYFEARLYYKPFIVLFSLDSCILLETKKYLSAM